MSKKFKQEQNGQAMVEMAIVIPILLLIVFSIIEFGWIFGAQLLVAHGSREGARHGAVHSTEADVEAQITGRVQTSASILNADELSININFTNPSRRGGDVVVQVSYPVTVITPFVSAVTGSPVLVQSQTVMRVE